MTRRVSAHFIYLFGILLYLRTGVTSRSTLFDPKGILQDLLKGSADGTTFTCPDTGNHPIPGKECTEDYYSCATGDAVPAVCAGASVFEPSTHVCTSSSTAPCKKLSTVTDSSTDPSSETTTYEPTAEGTLITTTTGPTRQTTTRIVTTTDETFVCLENGAFPNPNNCNTFYMCSNGIAYLYFCPSNLVFNPATGNCDYAFNVSGLCSGAV